METEHISLKAVKLCVCYVCFHSECKKSQHPELQVQQQLSVNSTVNNSTAGEKTNTNASREGEGKKCITTTPKSAHSYSPLFSGVNSVQGR